MKMQWKTAMIEMMMSMESMKVGTTVQPLKIPGWGLAAKTLPGIM